VSTNVGIWAVGDTAPVRIARSKVDLEKNLEDWIASDTTRRWPCPLLHWPMNKPAWPTSDRDDLTNAKSNSLSCCTNIKKWHVLSSD
jgi:hypothetical protein